MKKYKDIGIYDFSDYAEEITSNALFKINGGAEVENSDKGVAGAKPGDTITRKNGDVIVLKQADIDYAKAQLENNGNDGTGNTNGNSGTGNNSNSGSNNTSNSRSTNNSSSGANNTGISNTSTSESTLEVPEETKSNSYAYAAYMAKQGQAKDEGEPDRYKGYNVLGAKSSKAESPSAKVVKEKISSPVFVKAINTLYKSFINDGKKDIYTLGISASGTVTSVSGATGAGVYINPESDLRLFNSLLLIPVIPKGLKTVALTNSIITNMEDFGVYTGLEAGGGIGQSGSVSVSVGNFKSLEDAKGTYGCIGGSGGTSGFSIGGDAIISKNGIVGLAFSVGLGVGEKAEGHCRIGYTGIKSFKGEM